jgi:hypothetical protein
MSQQIKFQISINIFKKVCYCSLLTRWHRQKTWSQFPSTMCWNQGCTGVWAATKSTINFGFRSFEFIIIILSRYEETTQYMSHLSFQIIKFISKGKKKIIPVTGCGGLLRCEVLRIPYSLDNRLIDGGKIVSPTHRPRSSPQKRHFYPSGTHFC